MATVAKSDTMKYQPGLLQLGMSEEAKDLKCMEVRDSYQMILK